MSSEFDKLADAIGPLPAMILCAFVEASVNVYVPLCYKPGHILERVIGETIFPPSMRLDQVRLLGLVYRQSRRGQTVYQIASDASVTPGRVKQIIGDIASGSPLTPLARTAPSSITPVASARSGAPMALAAQGYAEPRKAGSQ